jgi:ribosomal protein L32
MVIKVSEEKVKELKEKIFDAHSWKKDIALDKLQTIRQEEIEICGSCGAKRRGHKFYCGYCGAYDWKWIKIKKMVV